MQIVMIGPPGCGKGTQSHLLSEAEGIVHLSTGEMLREAMRRSTPVGKRVADVIQRGNLASDDLIMELVAERLECEDCRDGCLFDGVPRNLVQARRLDELLAELGRPVTLAIELQVHESELARRIEARARQEGRPDDTPETLRRRLQVYQDHTFPILAYYRQQGILQPVDGTGTLDEVHRRIRDRLPRGTPNG